MSEIKAADVERFTRDLISLGGVYDVSEDGYVVNKGDRADELVTTKVGNLAKRIMILKEVIKDNDALIINPLNENITESMDARWLYMTLSGGLGRRFREVATFLHTVIELEKDEEAEKIHLTPETLAFASRHKDFDTKTYEAFMTITAKTMDFVNVWYNRKLKEAHFRCSIFDASKVTEFPQVTKKSWKIIYSLIADMLGVSDDPEKAVLEINEKFTCSSDLITVPKLESILKVYGKIYHRLNRYLDMCEMINDEDFVVDLTSLDQHIANISEYYQKYKWFTCTTKSEEPAIRAVGGVQPAAIISGIPSNPLNPNVPYQPTIGYVEPVSNIPSNPARQHQQQLNYANSAGGYQQPPMRGQQFAPQRGIQVNTRPQGINVFPSRFN